MKLRKIKNISDSFIISGGLLALLLFATPEDSARFGLILFISVVAIAIGMYVNFKYYRCPHCQSYLSVRTFSVPAYCPFCGNRIN